MDTVPGKAFGNVLTVAVVIDDHADALPLAEAGNLRRDLMHRGVKAVVVLVATSAASNVQILPLVAVHPLLTLQIFSRALQVGAVPGLPPGQLIVVDDPRLPPINLGNQ